MSRPDALWGIAIVVAAVAMFVVGRAIGGDGAPASAFDTSTPAYDAVDLPVAFTRGGFSGFGESGLEGRTTISGRVSQVDGNLLMLDTAGGAQAIRMTGDQRVRRFEMATKDDLRAGTAVVVLLSANGDARAVLVLDD
jgi:hypothetical protein